METVAIALLVGAFGGLAGAALGPFLGHIFNGWERRAVRRERRQEHLRSMIGSRIGDWRRRNAAVFTIWARVKTFNFTGVAAHQEFLEKEAVASPRGGQVWEPYRIGDDRLKADAEALNTGLIDLDGLIRKVKNASSIDTWREKCSEKASELDELTEKMQLRMDDLEW